VAALDRALALAEVDGSVLGADELDLDVARALVELLDEQPAVAEGAFGLLAGLLEGGPQLVGVVHAAHAHPPAAGGGLEQDREPDLAGDLLGLLGIGDAAFAAGAGRDADLLGGLAGLDLVADGLHGVRGGAHEREACVGDVPGEGRVLGEEPVARVDGFGARVLGGVDDRLLVEVRVGRGHAADRDRLVRQAGEGRVLVGFRVHGDRRDTELAAGVDDANRDLAAVRDEDLVEHRRC
jgi:hypothetical protein